MLLDPQTSLDRAGTYTPIAPLSVHIRSVAAAFSASAGMDREGPTPNEFSELNERWKDEPTRVAFFRQLILHPLRGAVDLPDVLYPLILSCLRPPSLPQCLCLPLCRPDVRPRSRWTAAIAEGRANSAEGGTWREWLTQPNRIWRSGVIHIPSEGEAGRAAAGKGRANTTKKP